MKFKNIGLFLGLAVSGLMLILGPPQSVPTVAWFTACCMVLMAIWWVTEAVPPAVTALLPLVLFPLLDINSTKVVASSYSHPIIYLFFGGFILSLAISKWNLHKRVALTIIANIGGSSGKLIASFMLTAAMLSMWISNTATTIMLLPIGLAIISLIASTLSANVDKKQISNFEIALLLSIAYSATVGGVATLIGTPPNAYMAAFIVEQQQIDISFIKWMAVGLPITLIMLPTIWFLLTKIVFPCSFTISTVVQTKIKTDLKALGAFSVEEKRVVIIFVSTILLWCFRPIVNKLDFLAMISDSTIAIFASISLFIVPATNGKKLLAWQDTKNMPWGILVLFGGGLALAAAMTSSGLAAIIGNVFAQMHIAHWVLVIGLVVTVLLLTEVTGNLSVVATFLPVVYAIAINLNLPVLSLIVPVTIAASCAFMLPVATPPNAIVYSANKFEITAMSKSGILLNLIAIIIIAIISTLIVPYILLA